MSRISLATILIAITVLISGCSMLRTVEAEYDFTVTDIEGNVYKTVFIGDMEWMAENLRVTRYRDGSRITGGLTPGDWYSSTSGAYTQHDDDMGSAEIYGKLYNWYAVADERGLCPGGWHVPTDEDWKQLEIYLGLTSDDVDEYGSRGTVEGGKLKHVGVKYWTYPNEGATNETGFTALPGAYYGGGYFIGLLGGWWTSTERHEIASWNRMLDNYTAGIFRLSNDKWEGFSVRCVRKIPENSNLNY